MSPVHVVVAVIVNEQKQVIIALRQSHQHQGDLWEFPGGKVEKGELAEVALIREIKEELGIKIAKPSPLIKVKHHYQDKPVFLDVWSATDFEGDPRGMEGQTIKWCAISALKEFDFPAANLTVIETIQATKF
jgi:8-oxo-dGTP diphosphatase